MKYLLFFLCILIQFTSCSPSKKLSIPTRSETAVNGKDFFDFVLDSNWHSRESIVLKEIESGNIPNFLRKLVPIKFKFYDSNNAKFLHVIYFVTADYLSIGNDDDFMRIPMTPILAQKIADSFHCFLPTRKVVNDVYENASIKIAPYPLTQFRDSILTFYQHHQLIEKERNRRKGLIAGIKKDIVITDKINSGPKTNKVAIYGWHKLDGNPIQPLYTGHVNWYVDYSHGVRLISKTIYIDEKKYDYTEILKSKSLRKILSDEDTNNFIRYPDHF
jgi:hypothetical protein